MKKKLQKSKKKHSTYRPKFARMFRGQKKGGSSSKVVSSPADELLQDPKGIEEKIKVNTASLPEEYYPKGSEAYRFPSWGYVVIVVVVVFVLGYLLF